MGKKTRIALYAASLLILCAMVALLIFSGGKGGTKAEQDMMGNAAESGGTSDDGETEGDSTDGDKTITEPMPWEIMLLMGTEQRLCRTWRAPRAGYKNLAGTGEWDRSGSVSRYHADLHWGCALCQRV